MHNHSDITLEISLGAIKHNYECLSRTAANSRAAAVVKANAYGLGAEKVIPALYSAGCRDFFVATLDEALEAVQYSGFDAGIYVFHGVKRGEEEIFADNGIIPVINDIYQLDIWYKKARANGLTLPCILHFDTGINRLGFNWKDAHTISRHDGLKSLDVKYLMSHLACITEEDHPLNAEQVKRLEEVRSYFPDIPVTLANSIGVFSGTEYHYDMIRPGCSLYGVKSGRDVDIKNVITVKAAIMQIREVQEDGFVGYGATKKIFKGMKLAVVSLGYADGYLRSLSNNTHAFYDGVKIQQIGRISMDMSIFDVSGIKNIKIGDEIEMMGDNYTVDEIAGNAGTIGYEILTSLGHRYRKIYKA